MAALLDGFQGGRAHVVASVIEHGRSAGVAADNLLEVVTRIDAIATALEHRMVHAHRVTELELARTTRDTAVQRLRRLLHGEAGETGTARRHCVVGDVTDAAVARRLEPALTAGDPEALSGLVDGRLAAVVTRRPRAGALTGALFVVSPPVPPAELPAVYALCRRALGSARPGTTGPYDLTSLALDIATGGVPELGELLAGELLGALDPADAFHRELAGTALAYLDHGGRIDPAAAALHVHPNTVKYRIRRLQELTGRPLTSQDDRSVGRSVRWWWALRSWSAR